MHHTLDPAAVLSDLAEMLYVDKYALARAGGISDEQIQGEASVRSVIDNVLFNADNSVEDVTALLLKAKAELLWRLDARYVQPDGESPPPVHLLFRAPELIVACKQAELLMADVIQNIGWPAGGRWDKVVTTPFHEDKYLDCAGGGYVRR